MSDDELKDKLKTRRLNLFDAFAQGKEEGQKEATQRIMGIIEKRMTVIGSDNINTSVDNVCGSLLSEIESTK